MALQLPQSFIDATERPQASDPLLWFMNLLIDPGSDERPPIVLRICDGSERIEWPKDNLNNQGEPDPLFWDPFPFSFTPMEQTQEGDLSEIDLSVDNTARMLMPWLHASDGLDGNAATLFLVPKNSLDISHPNHQFQRFDLEVAGAAATNEAVTFRLAKPNWFSISSPTDRYIPSRCRHPYASDACGYVLNALAAHPRCNKTFENCVERAADMDVRGLPPVLPGNYGGHPGVARQRA